MVCKSDSMHYPIICQSSKGSADPQNLMVFITEHNLSDSSLGYYRINYFILKNSYLYLQHFDLRVTWKNLYQMNDLSYRGTAK